MITRLPFNIYTSRLLQRRSQIAPVQQGWFMKLWQDSIREGVPPEEMKKEVEKRAKKQTKRLYRALGVQQWKTLSILLGFPFWMMSLEAVRRICGWSRGLQANTNVDGNSVASTPALQAPSTPLSDTAQVVSSTSGNAAAVSSNATTVADLPSTAAQVLDPALASDGILWFTDLTAADPYFILPTCYTVLMVLNVIPKDEGQETIAIASTSITHAGRQYRGRTRLASSTTSIYDGGLAGSVDRHRQLSSSNAFVYHPFAARYHGNEVNTFKDLPYGTESQVRQAQRILGHSASVGKIPESVA
ncbi:hypothetical protein PFICI_04029 [Pestalotiopsis fici W106-1]|uniref:Uncharacterized protein n=1 Tax=Pestalotiopsis fici (strain W106-1 / CGMCC3.15140) TaxID=1229662 RepID=W3XJ09_PESFW|nr:uncharacterized protein PFICI_04029 [Pestalotiopsis fici W106-1]ETS86004.1 hypothetical protein PFICI_04029 [Pestalotiopsis fici W106-1]